MQHRRWGGRLDSFLALTSLENSDITHLPVYVTVKHILFF
jgi:hypothetical protein